MYLSFVWCQLHLPFCLPSLFFSPPSSLKSGSVYSLVRFVLDSFHWSIIVAYLNSFQCSVNNVLCVECPLSPFCLLVSYIALFYFLSPWAIQQPRKQPKATPSRFFSYVWHSPRYAIFLNRVYSMDAYLELMIIISIEFSASRASIGEIQSSCRPLWFTADISSCILNQYATDNVFGGFITWGSLPPNSTLFV